MSPSRRSVLALAPGALAACRRRPAAAPPGEPFADDAALSAGARALGARANPGLLALGVADVSGSRRWVSDDQGAWPLGGLVRLPIVLAVLAQADAGALHLNDRLELGEGDLAPPPSRLGRLISDVRGGRPLAVPIADLVALALQEGDPIASDALMRRAGGPAAVQGWVRERGIGGLRIDRYDSERIPQMLGLREFRPEWKDPPAFDRALEAVPTAVRQTAMEAFLADPRDTTTLAAYLMLLQKLSGGALVAAGSRQLVLSAMTRRAGRNGGLASSGPRGAAWAQLAQSSPTVLGYTPVDASAALVTLAGGRTLAALSVLAGSTGTAGARARIFAEAGRLLARASP